MRLTALILFLFLFNLTVNAFAQVSVAFFEHRSENGQIHPLEPGGHFYHTAIQYGTQWMHARPGALVEIVDDVRKIGDLYVVIEIEDRIAEERYKAEEGKKFSIYQGWESKTCTYCSKLVAQILEIPPTPLESGLGVGISPDEIYAILKSRPHRERLACNKLWFAR